MTTLHDKLKRFFTLRVSTPRAADFEHIDYECVSAYLAGTASAAQARLAQEYLDKHPSLRHAADATLVYFHGRRQHRYVRRWLIACATTALAASVCMVLVHGFSRMTISGLEPPPEELLRGADDILTNAAPTNTHEIITLPRRQYF